MDSIEGARRLKIVVDGLAARSGGVQTYLINLMRYLPENIAAEIYLLALDSIPLPDRPEIKKVPLRWPLRNPFVRAAWARFRMPALIRELQADLLFCPGGIIGGPVSSRCKTLVMFRNMLPFDHRQRRTFPRGYIRLRHWLLERVLLHSMIKADGVIFISEFAKGVIEARACGKIKDATVIPHGINPHFRPQSNSAWKRPSWLGAAPYFLYVSNLDPYKSHVEVVRAYAMLRQRRITPEKLVLAGAESHWTPKYGYAVRSVIKELGLEGDVILPGKVAYEEIAPLYQNATLNIFASRCENCPNILLEALAAGRPILASKYPPMPEFAADAAIYFEPTSPSDLADRMFSILEDPHRMQEVAANALKQSAQFDWSKTATATWQAIESLCLRGTLVHHDCHTNGLGDSALSSSPQISASRLQAYE